MVIGLGTELVRVDELRDELQRADDEWLARRWTEAERETCLKRVDPAPGLAGRLAAKRAGLQALGQPEAAGLLDVEIVREPSGKPQLALHGPAQEAARRLDVARWHVSMTHLEQHALAVVIAEGADS